jgi:glycosyltransferase involved in cell wall biosynthesis
MPEGVSIVICCYKAAGLLPQTLACLAAQRFSTTAPASEVIVVDNSSPDETAKVALESWPAECSIPLRVVFEPNRGLTYARLRGLAEARYEIVCFVDHDNRVSPDWIETAASVMAAHPEVGACGGQTEAASEEMLPRWFEQFQSYYAVGPQGDKAGDITDTRGYLWGAGLCLRKRAWQMLSEKQFSFTLQDRRGQELSSGGDAELCYALRLTGWRLWYEPHLKMNHFMTSERLNWSYLRRVSRGFGAATPGLDAYEMAIKGQPLSFKHRLRQTWSWQILATIKGLLRRPLKLVRAPLSSMEGDADVLLIENLWGRLLKLVKDRGQYIFRLRQLKSSGQVHWLACQKTNPARNSASAGNG